MADDNKMPKSLTVLPCFCLKGATSILECAGEFLDCSGKIVKDIACSLEDAIDKVCKESDEEKEKKECPEGTESPARA